MPTRSDNDQPQFPYTLGILQTVCWGGVEILYSFFFFQVGSLFLAALGLYGHIAFSSHCLRASHCGGFSCFEAQALKHGLQQSQLEGLLVQQHMGMRDLPGPGIELIHVPCLGTQIPNTRPPGNYYMQLYRHIFFIDVPYYSKII